MNDDELLLSIATKFDTAGLIKSEQEIKKKVLKIKESVEKTSKHINIDLDEAQINNVTRKLINAMNDAGDKAGRAMTQSFEKSIKKKISFTAAFDEMQKQQEKYQSEMHDRAIALHTKKAKSLISSNSKFISSQKSVKSIIEDTYKTGTKEINNYYKNLEEREASSQKIKGRFKYFTARNKLIKQQANAEKLELDKSIELSKKEARAKEQIYRTMNDNMLDIAQKRYVEQKNIRARDLKAEADALALESKLRIKDEDIKYRDAVNANKRRLKDGEDARKKELLSLKEHIKEKYEPLTKQDKFSENLIKNSTAKYASFYKQQSKIFNKAKIKELALSKKVANKIEDLEHRLSLETSRIHRESYKEQIKLLKKGTITTEKEYKARLRAIDKLQGEANIAQRKLSRGAAGVFDSNTGTTFMHKVLTTGQYTAAAAAIYAVGNAFKEMAKAAIEADSAMYRFSGVLGTTLKASKELVRSNIQLGSTYGGSISEINNLTLTLGRAGVAVKDLSSSTKLAVQLATVTGDTFDDTAKVVSTFNIAFKDAGYSVKELGGLLAYTANATKMSTQDLGTMSNYALTTARTIGLTAEQILALSASFSNMGLNASTIGTQIRKLDVLFKSTQTSVIDFWEKFQQSGGMSRKEAFLDMDGFVKKLGELAKEDKDVFRGLTTDMDILLSNLVTNLGKSAGEYDKHIKKLKEGGDNIEAQAYIISQSIEKQFEAAWNKIKNMSSDFGTAIFDAFSSRDEVAALLSEINKLTKGSKEYSKVLYEIAKLTDNKTALHLTRKLGKESDDHKRVREAKEIAEAEKNRNKVLDLSFAKTKKILELEEQIKGNIKTKAELAKIEYDYAKKAYEGSISSDMRQKTYLNMLEKQLAYKQSLREERKRMLTLSNLQYQANLLINNSQADEISQLEYAVQLAQERVSTADNEMERMKRFVEYLTQVNKLKEAISDKEKNKPVIDMSFTDIQDSQSDMLQNQIDLISSTDNWGASLDGVAGKMQNLSKSINSLAVKELVGKKNIIDIDEKYAKKSKKISDEQLKAITKEGVTAQQIIEINTASTNALSKLKKKHTKEIGAEKHKQQQSEIQGYSQIAGAVSQMFEDGSKEAAAFRIIQDGLALSAAVTAIASSGMGDPYTAIPRVIAMTALMASILSNIGQNFISGGGASYSSDSLSSMQQETGKGTVFGYADKQSESIINSMELLSDYAKPQFRELQKLSTNFLLLDDSIKKVVFNAINMGDTSSNFKKFYSSKSSIDNINADNIRSGAGVGALVGSPIAGTVIGSILEINKGVPQENLLATALLTGPLGLGITTLMNAFGGGTSTDTALKDYGLIINKELITGAIKSLNAEAYQTVTTHTATKYYDWGWRTKDSYTDSTTTKTINNDLTKNVSSAINELYETIVSSAHGIGLSEEEIAKRLSDFKLETAKISFNKSPEDIYKDLSAYLSKTGDLLATDVLEGMLDKYKKYDEGMLETLERVFSNVSVVNKMLDTVGSNEFDKTKILDISEGLITLSGGLSSFGDMVSSYYDIYFSDEEKLTNTKKNITKIFNELNLETPKTNEEFRNILTSLDLTSEAGRNAYVTILQLSESFSIIGESAKQSQSNIKSWQDSFKSQEKLAKDMMSKFSYDTTELVEKTIHWFGLTLSYNISKTVSHTEQLAKSMEELDVIYQRMANDTDGLTDAELKALEANKVLIEARENEKNSLQQQLDLLKGVITQRDIDLAKIDDTNKALQKTIWAEEDRQKALEETNAILATSTGNIKSWQDGFKTKEELAKDMMSKFSYDTTEWIGRVTWRNGHRFVHYIRQTVSHTEQLATSMAELDKIYQRMSSDTDGLTGTELKALEANKALIQSSDNLKKAWETRNETEQETANRLIAEAGLRTNLTDVSKTTEEAYRKEIDSMYDKAIADGFLTQAESDAINSAEKLADATWDTTDALDGILKSFKDFADGLRTSQLSEQLNTMALKGKFNKAFNDLKIGVLSGSDNIGELGSNTTSYATSYLESLKETAKSQSDFALSQSRVASILENYDGTDDGLQSQFEQTAKSYLGEDSSIVGWLKTLNISVENIRFSNHQSEMDTINAKEWAKWRYEHHGKMDGRRVHAFAEGGIVTSPTVGLIGEAGYNEAIIPLKDSNDPLSMNDVKQELSEIKKFMIKLVSNNERQLNTQRGILDMSLAHEEEAS